MRPKAMFSSNSLIPNPTSEAQEFYVLHVLYKCLPTFKPNKPASWAWKHGPNASVILK